MGRIFYQVDNITLISHCSYSVWSWKKDAACFCLGGNTANVMCEQPKTSTAPKVLKNGKIGMCCVGQDGFLYVRMVTVVCHLPFKSMHKALCGGRVRT
jgi:hypothetical protein